MVMPALDLTGNQYGYLTVVRRYGSTSGRTKKATWLCRCACGTEVIRESQYLRTLHRPGPRHCGCQHGNKVHGLTGQRPHRIWSGMRQRCSDPSNKDWRNYGGRGITVCERWRDSFPAFWEDMGPTYAPGLTLDRIDTHEGYSKANCRWATVHQQANNTRVNRMLDTPDGRMTLEQAAQAYNLRSVTLHARLYRYGWPLLKALTTLGRCPYTTSRTAGRATGS